MTFTVSVTATEDSAIESPELYLTIVKTDGTVVPMYLLPPAFYLAPGETGYIGASGYGSGEYFTNHNGKYCRFVFNTSTPNVTMGYETIGGLKYAQNASYYEQWPGLYQISATWYNPTATPYQLFIVNNSDSSIRIAGIDYTVSSAA